VVVLDTHVLVWWASAPERLSESAASAVRAAENLGIPTMVFWELSLLFRKRRLHLDRPVSEWVSAVCGVPRVQPLVLTAEIALRADALDMHADPVDRFIVATALELGAPVITRDRQIRSSGVVETIW
jgi:PIN domain nuclease of toxin-antitoxin system